VENLVVLNYLEKLLGKSHKRARENYAFYCPFCSHHKPKLEVNLHTNEKGENPWECWVCNTKGRTVRSLLKQLKVDQTTISEVTKHIQKGSIDAQISFSLELPKGFRPLSEPSNSILINRAKKYLYNRGLTDNDFIKYNIGYCPSGEYADRIIVPSYDERGMLNYFVGRSVNPDTSFKYKNPSVSKDVIGFEAFINWDVPVVLCEGVFDAIAIKRNAIPLLGKTMSQSLLRKLALNKVKDVYIALDRDALKSALTISDQLLSMGKRVYLVDMQDKDPSSMGFNAFTEHVQTADEINLSKIMEYKLYQLC
jgi:DNA primase